MLSRATCLSRNTCVPGFGTGPTWGRMANRILLADDDQRVRELLSKRLSSAGYDVVEAGNDEEASRLYREAPTDVVITDIVMPGKGGRELINDLLHSFPEVRIVAISGALDRDITGLLGEASRLGALRTLAKPFTSEQLLDAVKAVLEGDIAELRESDAAAADAPAEGGGILPFLRWAAILAAVAALVAMALVFGWISF